MQRGIANTVAPQQHEKVILLFTLHQRKGLFTVTNELSSFAGSP